MTIYRGVHYLRKNFDSAAIVATLATVAVTDEAGGLSDGDHAVLAALRRSNSALEDAPLPEIQDYLRGLGDEQVPGRMVRVFAIEKGDAKHTEEGGDPQFHAHGLANEDGGQKCHQDDLETENRHGDGDIPLFQCQELRKLPDKDVIIIYSET